MFIKVALRINFIKDDNITLWNEEYYFRDESKFLVHFLFCQSISATHSIYEIFWYLSLRINTAWRPEEMSAKHSLKLKNIKTKRHVSYKYLLWIKPNTVFFSFYSRLLNEKCVFLNIKYCNNFCLFFLLPLIFYLVRYKNHNFIRIQIVLFLLASIIN